MIQPSLFAQPGIVAVGESQTFRVPFPPSYNVYWRTNRKTCSSYVSPEAKQYKTGAGWAAKGAGVQIIAAPTPVALKLDLYFPRDAGDASNRIKVLEDALSGIAYDDDKQVVHLNVTRYLIPPIKAKKGVSSKRVGFVIVTIIPVEIPQPQVEYLDLFI